MMMRNLLLLLCFLYEAFARTVVLPGTLYYGISTVFTFHLVLHIDGVPSFERDPFNYIVAIGGGSMLFGFCVYSILSFFRGGGFREDKESCYDYF